MYISADRFKSILAGTAGSLTSKETIIRQVAFGAERRGEDPMSAVEAEMPDVTIVRSDTPKGVIPPLAELLENARKRQATSSGTVSTRMNQPPLVIEKQSATPLRPVATQNDRPSLPPAESSTATAPGGAFTALLIYVVVDAGISFGLMGAPGILPFLALLYFGAFLHRPFLNAWNEIGGALGSYVLQVGPFILGVIGFFTLLHWIGAF